MRRGIHGNAQALPKTCLHGGHKKTDTKFWGLLLRMQVQLPSSLSSFQDVELPRLRKHEARWDGASGPSRGKAESGSGPACQDNCPPDPQQSPHDSFGFRALKCVNRSLPFAVCFAEFHKQIAFGTTRVLAADTLPRSAAPTTTAQLARPNKGDEGSGPGWVCLAGTLHGIFALTWYLFCFSGCPGHPSHLAPRPMATPSFSVDAPGNITISAPAEPSSTHHRFAFTDPSPGSAPARKRSFSGSAASDGGAAPDLLPEPPDSATPGTTQHHQAKGHDGSAQPSVGTPSSADGAASAKKRKTARGSRGVANLTPEQLDRKRANGMGITQPTEPDQN